MALLSTPVGAAIVGVSDRQPGVAARFAAQWDCPAFEDYQEMLLATRPEFVMAMGRHADMPAIARDLIEAHLPSAIEKPIGISAEQVAHYSKDHKFLAGLKVEEGAPVVRPIVRAFGVELR